MYKGIDVAVYQPTTLAYFKKARSWGARFAIVKASEGTNYTSASGTAQVANARAAGLATHGYHFSRFVGNENVAVAEANRYMQSIKDLGLKSTSVMFLDYEEAKGASSSNTKAVITFFRALINSGYKNVGFYSYYGMRNLWNIATIKKEVAKMGGSFVFWLANYGPNQPGMDGVDVWQYSDSGSFLGSDTDLNVDFNGVLVKGVKPPKAEYFDWKPQWLCAKMQIKAYSRASGVGTGKHAKATYKRGAKLHVKVLEGHRFQLTNGLWITANKAYVNNLYYVVNGPVKRVKSAKGTGRYQDLAFKHKVDSFKKGTEFDVKKVVGYGETTRLMLANGLYISGNKLINEFVK